jgi:hypothetical protein
MNTINGVFQSSISKFKTLSAAVDYKNHPHLRNCNKEIFLGDDELFWIVFGQDINKLKEANYSIAIY